MRTHGSAGPLLRAFHWLVLFFQRRQLLVLLALARQQEAFLYVEDLADVVLQLDLSLIPPQRLLHVPVLYAQAGRVQLVYI